MLTGPPPKFHGTRDILGVAVEEASVKAPSPVALTARKEVERFGCVESERARLTRLKLWPLADLRFGLDRD